MNLAQALWEPGRAPREHSPEERMGPKPKERHLPILMLSRLETKHFMSVQQIETKHSYLRNVKMLPFDPKNVKTEHRNISEHDCYNSRKPFFLFFAPVCSVLKRRNSEFHKALIRAIYHRRDQYCLSLLRTAHPPCLSVAPPGLSQGWFHQRAARPPAP